jgi:hypothetical protein
MKNDGLFEFKGLPQIRQNPRDTSTNVPIWGAHRVRFFPGEIVESERGCVRSISHSTRDYQAGLQNLNAAILPYPLRLTLRAQPRSDSIPDTSQTRKRFGYE